MVYYWLMSGGVAESAKAMGIYGRCMPFSGSAARWYSTLTQLSDLMSARYLSDTWVMLLLKPYWDNQTAPLSLSVCPWLGIYHKVLSSLLPNIKDHEQLLLIAGTVFCTYHSLHTGWQGACAVSYLILLDIELHLILSPNIISNTFRLIAYVTQECYEWQF